MTMRDALREGSARLGNSESPWLDATLIMGHVLNLSREKIMASYPDHIEEEVVKDFFTKIERRSQGYPVAYISGYKEFYGRDFSVKEGILCPRPDTEILIDHALEEILKHRYQKVHDLCTGSGCIAITLAEENQDIQMSASDISEISEEIFILNSKQLSAQIIPFTRTSLLDEIPGPFDLIVSNPPYLTCDETNERLNSNWKEPGLALDGGEDGLDLIRIIIKQSEQRLNKNGMLMMEADPRQMDAMSELMKASGFYDIMTVCDLAGDERVISGVLGQ